MTRQRLYEIIEQELSQYIEKKATAYLIATGKQHTDIFRAFNSEDEVVIDFCTQLIARRSK